MEGKTIVVTFSKVQILHNYGRGWSRDLKKVVVKVQSGSGLKHSGARLKWRKILEKTRSNHKTPHITRTHALIHLRLAKVTSISQSQRIRDVKWVNIHILKLQTPCVKRGLKKSFLNASSSGFPRHGSVTSAIRKSIKSKTRRSLIDHLNAFNNCAFFFQNQQPRPLLGTQHRQVKNSTSL